MQTKFRVRYPHAETALQNYLTISSNLWEILLKASEMSSQDHTYCKKHERRHANSLHQTAKRSKMETVQEEELRKLEDCYVVSTPVLREIHQNPGSSAATTPGASSINLTIHSLSSPAYQRVYHSVVDPMLVTSTGNPTLVLPGAGPQDQAAPVGDAQLSLLDEGEMGKG
ncbi:hypothetical protein AMELA_G00273940 [Ameiurus melas]|uniref:Uncharacterized protein n=1 Tax=Ameiurus melas TaxID=219545 RepID=A0A7J5ZLA4_AMEME|nr:hypothetical protein AMELA_G00273940 [Ameiurus melas]